MKFSVLAIFSSLILIGCVSPAINERYAQPTLDLLVKWGDGDYTYNLYDVRDIELHRTFQKCDLVEQWFAKDLREQGYDFLEFGYTRAGDPYTVWMYPGLIGEPPVVLLDSDGDVKLLAPSLVDFLCLLTDPEAIKGNIEDDKAGWYSILNYQYRDILGKSDYYENVNDVANTVMKEAAESIA